MRIEKKNNTIFFETDAMTIAFPAGTIVALADEDSVNIKLRASRKTIITFNYKDMTPSMPSAEAAVQWLGTL